MIKARKSAVFATDKLKYFLDDYTFRRMRGAQLPAKLVDAYGAVTSSDAAFDDGDDEDAYFASRQSRLH